MSSEEAPAVVERPPGRVAWVASVGALVASTAMVSAYQANQNTYLLHAVASEGGSLRHDRLARTPDPTPVFTATARAALRLGGGPVGLYVLWMLAGACFFAALAWAVRPLLSSRRAVVVWTAAMAVVAGPVLGSILASLTDAHLGGLTAPGALLGGVAEQYALGQYLQPSVAGVLLVLATVAAVRHREHAVWSAGLFAAGIVHPTYLVTAWIVAGGLALARAARSTTTALRVRALAEGAAVALVASVPGAIANRGPLRAARGSSAAVANEILADHRLPHHANPGHWFEPATAVLLVAVVFLLWAGRRWGGTEVSALAEALLATAALSFVLSVGAVVADDPGLRLLFPWRASIVVVPLAVAIGVALAASQAASRARSSEAVAIVIVVALAAAGMARTVDSLRHPVTDDPLVALVRDHPPRGEGLVPPGEEDLRLNGGHPIYADFKNHPFAPAAVVSWWDRYRLAAAAQSDPDVLCRLVRSQREGWVVAPRSVVAVAGRSCLEGWSALEVGRDDLVYLRRPHA